MQLGDPDVVCDMAVPRPDHRIAAQLFANDLDRLSETDWDRTVIYTYPHRAERSLRWLAIHTVHEVRHHLLDVRRQIPGGAGFVPR